MLKFVETPATKEDEDNNALYLIIEAAAKRLKEADRILVVAGNGMSSAVG